MVSFPIYLSPLFVLSCIIQGKGQKNQDCWGKTMGDFTDNLYINQLNREYNNIHRKCLDNQELIIIIYFLTE